MIRVNSTVRMNFPKITQLTQAQVTALEQTAEAVHSEVVQAQVVPRDTGAMQGENTFIKAGETTTATYKDGSTATNSVTKERDGKASIVTASPQVRRLYYHPEYHVSKDENPNAKGHWFEDWEEGGKHAEFAINTYKEIDRRWTGL